MSFKEKYTTADLITSDTSLEKKEKEKIVLSNDAYAIGQLLETLINTARSN
jgi:hypothetical protein